MRSWKYKSVQLKMKKLFWMCWSILRWSKTAFSGYERIDINSKEIKNILKNGEKIDVGFKESKNALTKDVFDTAYYFNNRNGEHILLGVNDKREIVVLVKIR